MEIPWFKHEVYHGRMIDETAIRKRYEIMRPGLDERGRRMLAAAEARTAGYGGVRAVARATGIARSTIDRGLKDLEARSGTAKGSSPGRRRTSITHADRSDADGGPATLGRTARVGIEEPCKARRGTTRHGARGIG